MIAKIKAMTWQDAIFSLGEIVFMFGLVPTVLEAEKPSPVTSFTTAAMLYAFLAAQVSLGLKVVPFLTVITATIWVILGVQAL